MGVLLKHRLHQIDTISRGTGETARSVPIVPSIAARTGVGDRAQRVAASRVGEE